MEKFKKAVEVIFSINFLLKIILIQIIFSFLQNGIKLDINVDVDHRGSVNVGSQSGGFEIKVKE